MTIIKKILKFILTIFGVFKLILLLLQSIFIKKKKCIFVSNDFSLSGAPVVLLEVAKIYKKEGYEVYIFSKNFGKMIKNCRQNKIKYVIIPFAEKLAQKLYSLINFEFYFINTIVNYSWIEWLNGKKVNVIWWIHEGTTYIKKYEKVKNLHINKNIKVLAVSNWTINELEKNNIYINPDLLYYGCSDLVPNGDITIRNKKEKFNILIVGSICSRKNQIYLLEQYFDLEENEKDMIEMIFIGKKLNDEEEYYKKFINEIEKDKRIKYYQSKSRDEIKKFFEEMNLLICSSIDDPLPVVVTESFMYKKPVLISNNTGQYSLVKDGVNGFVYNNEKKNDLRDSIKRIIHMDKNKVFTIGIEGRKIYDNYFNIENFEKKLKEKMKWKK